METNKNCITIKHSIIICKRKELVWDYTQNYENRSNWDNTVLEATVLQSTPKRIVRLKARGNAVMTYHHMLDDCPNKTSLVAEEIISPLIESAGGSWCYDKIGKGTIWKQTNTIVLKNNLMARLMRPFYKWLYTSQTKSAMERAKKKMEIMSQ